MKDGEGPSPVRYALLAIVFLSAWVRLWQLGWPAYPYADELFYVVDGAENYLRDLEDANRAHPPLGKLLIAASIVTSGWLGLEGPVTWRLGSVAAGLSCVVLVFALGRSMARDWRAGALASFLVGTSLLHITQSRMATLDIYLTLFVLAGVAASWMLLKAPPEGEIPWMVAGATAFALATAVKLSGLLGAVGALLAVALLKRSARLGLRLLALGLTATLAVSVACYLPLVGVYNGDLTRTAGRVWTNHQMVWNHRAQGRHRHPDLAPWWQWPLALAPTWYMKHVVAGSDPPRMRVIAAFGSPVFWWGFLALLAGWLLRRGPPKDDAVRLCLIVYLAQTVGWCAVPGFFYYMVVNVPLMALLFALVLRGWRASVFLVGILLCLICYWPVASGAVVTVDWLRFWLGPWL